MEPTRSILVNLIKVWKFPIYFEMKCYNQFDCINCSILSKNFFVGNAERKSFFVVNAEFLVVAFSY